MAKKRQLKMNDVCREVDIQPYVLRYWETEFPFLKSSKSRAGQRVYGQDELALLRRIKALLYEEGYTIAGAKKKLEAELEAGGPVAEAPAPPTAGPAADQALEARVATLETGVRDALGQARDLLRHLDSA